ncbi:MAG: metallophosphoesterase [Candidatus Kariarchaeaceae archaeon]|jgi:protein phosphatase
MVPQEIQATVERLLEIGPLVTDFIRDELEPVIEYWTSLLKKQRLLHLIDTGSVLVLGDIHGDYLQLRRAFHYFDTEAIDYIIIAGDLIDRGPEMIECLEYVMSRQIMDPEHVIFLRGNHELKAINEMYGFRGYCTGIYGSAIYDKFAAAFQQLPLAALVGDWALICHGGIPNGHLSLREMRISLKPKEPEEGTYAQMLWNDPDPAIENFGPSMRGQHYYRFGGTVFNQFMDHYGLKYLIRAHQAFPEGYRWMFDNRLLSLFSSKAGPYMNINPHFALLINGEIQLIAAENIEFNY